MKSSSTHLQIIMGRCSGTYADIPIRSMVCAVYENKHLVLVVIDTIFYLGICSCFIHLCLENIISATLIFI
jgi:hypothetical protein